MTATLNKMPPVLNIAIAVDFDGTIVKHEFPKIGEPVPHAIRYLKEFQEVGASLILYTMRDKEYLEQAIKYCSDNFVYFREWNCNPTQSQWTSSPKCYAHIYIDDAAIGCPLIFPRVGRPYADWQVIGPIVLGKILAWKQGRFYSINEDILEEVYQRATKS